MQLKRASASDAYLFKEIFGTPLHPFMHPLLGFDIVGFDELVLKSPDGKSCADVLKERYGQKAYELIKRLNSI